MADQPIRSFEVTPLPRAGFFGPLFGRVPHAAVFVELLPLASCITPNCFELGWLIGKPVSSKADVLRAAATLPHRELLVTSTPVDSDSFATLAITGSKYAEAVSAAKPSVPHGTGDFPQPGPALPRHHRSPA